MNPPSSTDWREKLREKGYRLTPQRELILGAIDALGHATPDEVLAEVLAEVRKKSSALNVVRVEITPRSDEEVHIGVHVSGAEREGPGEVDAHQVDAQHGLDAVGKVAENGTKKVSFVRVQLRIPCRTPRADAPDRVSGTPKPFGLRGRPDLLDGRSFRDADGPGSSAPTVMR